jgi:hypothetical protein
MAWKKFLPDSNEQMHRSFDFVVAYAPTPLRMTQGMR